MSDSPDRFKVLEGNPLAIFDRAEGRTFNLISTKEAIALCEVLNVTHKDLSNSILAMENKDFCGLPGLILKFETEEDRNKCISIIRYLADL